MNNCPFMVIAAILNNHHDLTGECLEKDCQLWMKGLNCCSFKMMAMCQAGLNIYDEREAKDGR